MIRILVRHHVAGAFMDSPKLREAMAAAGVTGALTTWFTSPAAPGA